MRLSQEEYAAFAFPQLLPSLLFPLTRILQHGETHPGVPKCHSMSCAHRTHTSTDPGKTLGTQNPNIQHPRDLSAWDNNAAPAFTLDHKTVLFARLHLLVVPFPRQSSPSSHLRSHSSSEELALHALPWSLHIQSTSQLQEAQKNSSHSTIKCSLDLPSPGTAFPFIALTLQPSHVPSLLPVGRHRSRCRARDKRWLSRARRSKPSQDRPWAMSPSK